MKKIITTTLIAFALATGQASAVPLDRELSPSRNVMPMTRSEAPPAAQPSVFPAPLPAARLASLLRASATPQPAAISNTPRAVPADFGVFASVAISAARLPMLDKYKRANGQDYSALFTQECAASGLDGCDSRLGRRLAGLADKARGLGREEILDLVNREINAALAYQSDSANWGAGDHWANPSQMAVNGAGDCEDFANLKMWALRSLGFAAAELQIVVLQDTRRRLYHAVLAVHVDGRSQILDNLAIKVVPDTAYSNYLPIMSFTASQGYLHGFTNRDTSVAAGPLSAVRPGEGL
ncbi:MAG: transglutaminase-like cysteine peptidase [Devosia sp.]